MVKTLSYIFILLLLIATTALSLLVTTHHAVSMNLADRMQKVGPDGKTLVYYCVEVSDYDSLLFREYITRMYHKEISDSLNEKEAVQMDFYFYKENDLTELNMAQLYQLTGGDPSKLALFKNLEIDSTGYYGLRLSEPYMMFDRDTLYLRQGGVLVPRHGAQLKDFLQNATHHQ